MGLVFLEFQVGQVLLVLQGLREPQVRQGHQVQPAHQALSVEPVLQESLGEVEHLALQVHPGPQVQQDFQVLLETLDHQALEE